METNRSPQTTDKSESGAQRDDFEEKPSRRVPTQGPLRFFQFLSACLFVLLIGAFGVMLYRTHRAQPVSVLVAGSPVTTVVDFAMAQSLVARLAQLQFGSAYGSSADPRPSRTIRFERVAQSSPVDSQSTALSRLSAAVAFTAIADVISINGVQVVALPDQQSAQAALDEVRTHYAALPPADTVIGKPEFREHVTIDRTRAPADICKPTADAARQLLLTAPPAKQYTVGMHETGWSIAHKFHIGFSDFIRANPGRDLNNLRPGDTVNVSRSFPPLTVIVHKEQTTTQPIEKGVPAAQAGLRQVTSVDTYINGVRTGQSSPVSIYTIRRAVPHDIVE